jgi:hypothetical protein
MSQLRYAAHGPLLRRVRPARHSAVSEHARAGDRRVLGALGLGWAVSGDRACTRATPGDAHARVPRGAAREIHSRRCGCI